MVKKSLFKRVVSVALATVLAVGGFQIYSGGPTIVSAETSNADNPLTTIVRQANVGSNTGGSVEVNDGVFNITGAGKVFGKDTNSDDFFYTYFKTTGKTTVVAKVTPDKANKSGYVGLIAKNGTEATDFSAGVYWDYSKGNVRIGRHGGAGNICAISANDSLYVKLIFTENSVKYTVATDADFTNVIINNGMGSTGLSHKNVGIFATEGNKVTVSDLKITSEYTDDLGQAVKKVVYDSSTGELIPTFSSSTDYGAEYKAADFTSSVNGNILKLVNTMDSSKGNKGDLRSGKSVNYLLFPATTKNLTVSADITINDLNSATDKHGIAVGQFAAADAKVGSSKMTCSVLQANKNNVTQHNFTKNGGGVNGGNPKSTATVTKGGTYNLAYTKNSDNTAVLVTTSSNGTVIGTNETAPFALTDAYSLLASGSSVQYGLAITAADVDVTNLKLVDEDGWVLYDQNDYYIVTGVAPTVKEITTAKVNDDRSAIELAWTAEGGVGNVQYVIMVSKDGGAYKLSGTSKSAEYSFKPDSDGIYKFKVYGKSGDSSSEASAAESNDISYVTPLDKPVLDREVTGNNVKVTWSDVTNADKYNLYRTSTTSNDFKLIKSFDSGVGSFEETLDTYETYYYYMVAENTTTKNTSNPSDTLIVLTNPERSDINTANGDEAANITITNKSNDTVLDGKAVIEGTVDRAGTIRFTDNEGNTISSKELKANDSFKFDTALNEGRNEYLLLFEDTATNKITKKSLNFVYLKKWDITVDAAFTGTDGDKVDGIPTYKTVQAAVNTVPADNNTAVVIFVKNGQYEERVTVTSPYISILGEDRELTRIYKSVAVADKTATGMWDRNAFYVDSTADYFTLENVTIENSYPYKNASSEQADALAIVADNVICVNTKLVGYQDTLLVDSRVKDSTGNYEKTKQYFYKCYITGNVDFIYGSGSAYFNDCDIVARYTDKKDDGCYTAARTYDNVTYGLVFYNCRFLKEDKVAAKSYRLARPWGKDASATFIGCYLGDALLTPLPYDDMSGVSFKTARFREFLTYGPGFAMDNDRLNFTDSEGTLLYNEVLRDTDSYAGDMNKMYISNSTPEHKHVFSEDWAFDENNHWHACTAEGCDGTVDAKAEHTASGWIIDKAATEKETGKKHKECTVCKYVMQTEDIPKLTPSVKPGDIKTDIEQKKDTPKTDADIPTNSVNVTEAEKALINNGVDLKITLNIENADTTTDKTTTGKINDVISKEITNGVIGKLLNIDLFKQVGNNTPVSVKNANSLITIKMTLAGDLLNTDSTKDRTYSVVRVHDGKAEIISNVSFDKETNVLTFKTDKFSTYAIVYSDKAKSSETPVTPVTPEEPAAPVNSPDTADASTMTIIFMSSLLSISVLGAAYVLLSQAESKKRIK